ncbi:MAG: response regulator [Blautia sp.]|nr:response regulator [Blautia sp.]
MERELTVLVIEDDEKARRELAYYIDEAPGLKFQDSTNSSEQGLVLAKACLPDVVILDLELHHGSGNGLLFLAGLAKLELPHLPYILVTTNNSSNVTYEQARTLGADFIMSKHEENYSAKYVVEFLQMLKDMILGARLRAGEPEVLTEEEMNRRLVMRIQRELGFVGISPKAKGFQYLTDAILITYREPQPNVCRKLSGMYRKSAVSIERAMQNAINRAWQLSDPDDLLEHYTARIRSDKGVPTMMEFICYYANLLKQN